MRRLAAILLICVFYTPSFGQWKSYYPEGKSSKKNQVQLDNKKIKTLFETHYFKALKSKSLEDYDEALNQFEKCIKINEKSPNPFYESAIINTEKGNYPIAIEQIKAAVKLDPENRWYLLLYAEILFSKQDFYNAAIRYKKLISLEPGNEELYFKLSDTYIYANDLKKAIAVYNGLQKHKGVEKILSMQKHKLYEDPKKNLK